MHPKQKHCGIGNRSHDEDKQRKSNIKPSITVGIIAVETKYKQMAQSKQYAQDTHQQFSQNQGKNCINKDYMEHNYYTGYWKITNRPITKRKLKTLLVHYYSWSRLRKIHDSRLIIKPTLQFQEVNNLEN